MQYVKFEYHTPYMGCDREEYVAFSEEKDPGFLQNWADEKAIYNGEEFEYLALADLGDDEVDNDDIIDNYWSEIEGSYTIISEDEWIEGEGYVI